MPETNLLPLGTIVKLKDHEVLDFMIIGYYPVKEDTRQLFEYSSLLYPQGFLNQGQIFMFNSEDIEGVAFKGYSDEESEEYRDGIEGMIYIMGESFAKEGDIDYENES